MSASPDIRKPSLIAQDTLDFHLHKPPQEAFNKAGHYSNTRYKKCDFKQVLGTTDVIDHRNLALLGLDKTGKDYRWVQPAAAQLLNLLKAIASDNGSSLTEPDLNAIRAVPRLIDFYIEKYETDAGRQKAFGSPQSLRQSGYPGATQDDSDRVIANLDRVIRELGGSRADADRLRDDLTSDSAHYKGEVQTYAKNLRGDLTGLFQELATSLDIALDPPAPPPKAPRMPDGR